MADRRDVDNAPDLSVRVDGYRNCGYFLKPLRRFFRGSNVLHGFIRAKLISIDYQRHYMFNSYRENFRRFIYETE
jgi:hypothetical protein